MPSKSTKQRKYVFYLRGKYKTKAKAPKKYKWAFEKGWEHIKEEKKYSPNVFDQYAEQMAGAAVGGANAPMSTGSTGIANTKDVGTMMPGGGWVGRPRRKKKVKA